MADHYSSDDQERHEPTLGHTPPRGGVPESESGGQEHARLTKGDRVQHERRDERGYIRVALPFRVRLDDGSTLPGSDVSLGGFSAQSERGFQPGEKVSASLLLMAGPTELIVPLKAECLRVGSAAPNGGGQRASFEIIDIEPPHRELLRQVIRSALSGRSPDIEGLMAGEDPQTPHKRQIEPGKPRAPARPPKPMGRYIILFLAIGLLVLVGAATAYRNFMLIEPSFAAVTAPRIDIRAPGPGILAEHELQAGDRVERDQLLTNVENSDLESDLILADAALNYNNRLIENLQEHMEAGNQEVSLANSAQPASGDTMTFESVSPEIAQARIEQFETVRDYENSRITALEARKASNNIYSPCDCLVAWALSSADGTYINESERIMTLIRTGDDDVMVEALVHMNDINRIEPNQQAYITLANSSEPIRARVRNVALDVERQPRAGFPNWVRQQQNVASVLLVPEETLPAESVGQPVDVRFTEAPLLGAASERIWQGVRTVIQFGDNIYRAALEENDDDTDEG
ncbi:HlyD family efflux transporter periplasmic adaptor subunit [Billgrantia endophytica]|uniref:Alginate biosynthesis protein Alg44 n=1 Tax=Billgrantia endophytica TaxID=2033802 RepID=A0A2N7U0B4_9GAMM|nr:HlyD family efflux transporter periplasmic adaptor subunit [Halomonas endophytica]PMR73852.1 alginate biosynthesis protein Alg44 [Halomonas endophytica]